MHNGVYAHAGVCVTPCAIVCMYVCVCVTVCDTMYNCVHACVRPCAILCIHHVFKTMHNCVWWSCPTSAVLMTMSTPFIDLAHYQLI